MSTVILPPIHTTTILDGLNNKNLYPIPQASQDLLYNYAFLFVNDINSTFVVPPSEDGKPIVLSVYGKGYVDATYDGEVTLNFNVQNNSGVTIHTVLQGKVYEGISTSIDNTSDAQSYATVYVCNEIEAGATKKIGKSYNTTYSESCPIEAQCLIFYEAS